MYQFCFLARLIVQGEGNDKATNFFSQSLVNCTKFFKAARRRYVKIETSINAFEKSDCQKNGRVYTWFPFAVIVHKLYTKGN